MPEYEPVQWKLRPFDALDTLGINPAPRQNRLMLSREVLSNNRNDADRGKVTCRQSKMRRRATQAMIHLTVRRLNAIERYRPYNEN